MVATKRRVSGAMCPAREFKLNWAGYRSWVAGESGTESGTESGSRPKGVIRDGSGGSSSSASKRKTLDAHLCPRWYFSSQLKQRSRSRREAISSEVSRLKDGGGGLGEGMAVEIGRGAMEGEGGGRLRRGGPDGEREGGGRDGRGKGTGGHKSNSFSS